MAEGNPSAGSPRAPNLTNLDAILGRFSDAYCVLECAARSIENCHEPSDGLTVEVVCLRHGIDMMSAAYNELDLAINELVRAQEGGSNEP